MRQQLGESSGNSVSGVLIDPVAVREQTAIPERFRTFGKMVHATEKLLVTKMLHAIGDPPIQLVLWDGQVIQNHAGEVVARVLIHDSSALLKLVGDPELCFGELYSERRIEVQGDLLDFLEAVYRVWPFTNPRKRGKRFLPSFDDACRNTITDARNNIHHHYDVGNEFYKLWLDRRMVYTCAYFPSPDTNLEDAQLAKMDYICRKLNLKPGEQVVEAGCGWGALALYMAKHYGVTVAAYNISGEQIAYARQCARLEGLEDRVEFIEDDYRNVRGEFDAFVSVGMLEHVGTDHYQELGEVIDLCLKGSARGLIHTIGLNYSRPMDAWTERHIFPGASPPSLAEIMQIFEPYDFSVLDVENLRLHYALTLQHWLQRYENHAETVGEMFDAEFVRAWRLYLAGSYTAFKAGGMQLFQITFSRSGNNQLPWTRQYLYEPQTDLRGVGNGEL